MVREWKVLSLITAYYHLMIENTLILRFQLLFFLPQNGCIGTLPSYVDGGDFTCYLLWAVPSERGARYWHKKAAEPSPLRRRSE